MAVFTPVTLNDLIPWISQYDVGTPTEVKGISSGIENSNFFVTTEKGEFVLTLFEKLTTDQLPYYLNLMHHLATYQVKVASPIPDKEGFLFSILCQKPACLVNKLEGNWIPEPKAIHCKQVGEMMARMHLAAQNYPMKQPNLRGISWWNETVPQVIEYLSRENAAFLKQELDLQNNFASTDIYLSLPSGPVHADLFRNNVMFNHDELSGFFDFYFAGNDTWLFDVAVAVNDWCIDLNTGEFDRERLAAFLKAYNEVRPFTDNEMIAWQTILRAASLRFWLSRLYDFYLPRTAEMLTPHDPTHFERILKLRSMNKESLVAV